MTTSYKVGDTIIQHCHGNPHIARVVVVTSKSTDIKNGRPGFSGMLVGGDEDGLTVWGYDTDVHEVISSVTH